MSASGYALPYAGGKPDDLMGYPVQKEMSMASAANSFGFPSEKTAAVAQLISRPRLRQSDRSPPAFGITSKVLMAVADGTREPCKGIFAMPETREDYLEFTANEYP